VSLSCRLVPVVVVLLAAGCAGTGGASPSPPAAAPPVAEASPTTPHRPEVRHRSADAVRTVVTTDVGGIALVTEIVESGDRYHGTFRTPLGITAEEILVGDDLYQRAPDAAAVLGTDGWLHADLSDDAQLAVVSRKPLGVLRWRALATVEIGDRFSDRQVILVHQVSGRERTVELEGLGRFTVITEILDGPADIAVPDDVVELVDLPRLVGGAFGAPAD
jgi:hypothetical protein